MNPYLEVPFDVFEFAVPILPLGRLLFGPKLQKSLHKDIVKYSPLGVCQEMLSLGMIFLDTLFADRV